MDRRTLTYRSPRPRHPNPVVVLEIDDVELVEDTYRRSSPRRASPVGHRYPPAITDRELSRLVDECTEELCSLDLRNGYRGWSGAFR